MCTVRKHPAPQGALRQSTDSLLIKELFPGQKARSAIRCIKTPEDLPDGSDHGRQKAWSAIRCIKTPGTSADGITTWTRSESTEHYEVH